MANSSETGMSFNSDATDFFQLVGSPTAVKAMTGDREKLDARVFNAIGEAQRGLVDGVKLVQGLAVDSTKNHILANYDAKTVADRTILKLEQASQACAKVADELMSEATSIIGKTFKHDSNDRAIDRNIEWLNRTYKDQENGVAKISAAIKADRGVAGIFHDTSLRHLIEMGDESFMQNYWLGIKSHALEAEAKIDQAKQLSAQSHRYPSIIERVRSTFYKSSLIAKMSTRVEI